MKLPNVDAVIAQAKALSSEIKTDQDAIAKLSLLHASAGTELVLLSSAGKAARFSLANSSVVAKDAGGAFKRAKELLHKIVCDDLKFCKNEGSVTKWLKDHLPDIAKKLLKGSPAGIIARILGLLGLGSASWAAVAAIALAWLINTGLEKLCDCKS